MNSYNNKNHNNNINNNYDKTNSTLSGFDHIVISLVSTFCDIFFMAPLISVNVAAWPGSQFGYKSCAEIV